LNPLVTRSLERNLNAGVAWYVNDREAFVHDPIEVVVGKLASGAAAEGLHIEQEQHEEWRSSVGVLQRQFQHHTNEIDLLKTALAASDLFAFRHVILEFDFRRRGLRMDCVLIGDGVISVIEFKRNKLGAADREQVINYAINLVEFHEETHRLVNEEQCIVAPLLVLTNTSKSKHPEYSSDFLHAPWGAVLARPLQCDSSTLHSALRFALDQRRDKYPVNCHRWLSARFSPSSTILDAAISLYGEHDVSAIAAHAAPVELIDLCSSEVTELAIKSQLDGNNRIIFVSGAPGAGKTLVGLKLAFDKSLRKDAVFVTGNSPLVEVLGAALKGAYKSKRKQTIQAIIASGYAHEDAARVIGMSTFKLVKAHAFLGERGKHLDSADGRVIIFDEAQRTYRKGRLVLRKPLASDEAQLILESLQQTHPAGAVVVALIGHNQAINNGEMGIKAWFTAAETCGWNFAISDETLALNEVSSSGQWANHPLRENLRTGHLPHSMRYYRNGDLERWADFVLAEHADMAAEIAEKLDSRGDTIWITRDLATARQWVRERRVGQERAGLIASGQARRLASEGLFVDHKPDIATWMLSPSGDVRSSNMLETVQNQYQVQGLELDYTVVCWDADLRRSAEGWKAWKMSGSSWQKDKEIGIASNSYRVLLTRARKGMILFIPKGDRTYEDETRTPLIYDEIAHYLIKCGGKELLLEST
jgi:hypothetical protein